MKLPELMRRSELVESSHRYPDAALLGRQRQTCQQEHGAHHERAKASPPADEHGDEADEDDSATEVHQRYAQHTTNLLRGF